jgi:predicted flap endonuclease-1-like 5' DNA nuclease
MSDVIVWIEANPLLCIGVALVLLGLVWLALSRRKRTLPQRDYHDVLSEGAGPAQRNSALIDTAPLAAIVTPIVADAPLIVTGDDLTRIKGVGPKLSRLLGELGVTSYSQIAGWSEADIAAIDASLGSFAGRPTRDSWVEQAALLMGGDTAAYEAKFGKL